MAASPRRSTDPASTQGQASRNAQDSVASARDFQAASDFVSARASLDANRPAVGDPRGRKNADNGEPADKPAAASPSPEDLIAELDFELNRLQRRIRLAIETKLATLAGRSFGSLEANRACVNRIHRMLEAHALRVKCPECGTPAILRVSPRKGASHGSFVFDHKVNGKRTFHGGAGRVPELVLIAKPPRKAREAD